MFCKKIIETSPLSCGQIVPAFAIKYVPTSCATRCNSLRVRAFDGGAKVLNECALLAVGCA
eukprot:5789920-Pleurochrysis_carterae.AAC.2